MNLSLQPSLKRRVSRNAKTGARRDTGEAVKESQTRGDGAGRDCRGEGVLCYTMARIACR